jgi:hypothetical protein
VALLAVAAFLARRTQQDHLPRYDLKAEPDGSEQPANDRAEELEDLRREVEIDDDAPRTPQEDEQC